MVVPKLPYTNLSIRQEAAKKLIAFAKRNDMSTMEFFDELAKRIPDQVDSATLFAVLENSILLKLENVSISIRAQAYLVELFYKLQRAASIIHTLVVLAEKDLTPYHKGSLHKSHKRMNYWLLLKPLEPKIINALIAVRNILNKAYPDWSIDFADTSAPFIFNPYTDEEACKAELSYAVDEALKRCDQIEDLGKVVPENSKTLEASVRPALDELKSILGRRNKPRLRNRLSVLEGHA